MTDIEITIKFVDVDERIEAIGNIIKKLYDLFSASDQT